MADGVEENKEDKKRINFRNKTVGAILLMLVLFIPVCAGLYFLGRSYSWKREVQQEQMHLDILKRIVRYGNQQYLEAQKDYEAHICKEADLTVSFLKQYVKDGKYTGPEVVPDGFVVRDDGGRVLLPADLPLNISADDRSLIVENVRSGNLSELTTRMDDNTEHRLCFGRISDNAVYVQVSSEESYNQYMKLYREEIRSALKSATEISGGMLLIIKEENGSNDVLEQFGEPLFEEDVSNLGSISSSEENIQGRRKVNGKNIYYTSIKTDGTWLGCGDVYFIQATSLDSIISHQLLVTFMICLLMMILYTTIITYSLSEEEYVLKTVIDVEKAKEYNPRRLRRKLRSAGVVSAAAILAVAFLTQSVIQMRQQTAIGKRTLSYLSELGNRDAEKSGNAAKEMRENWFLQYAKTTAAFLENATLEEMKERLGECCTITDADFAILFDHEGNEILSSNDFTDLTMERGLGENSRDFRRLLYGIDGIIRPVSEDSTTGLARQMIGAPVNLAGDGKYGALILALAPEVTEISGEIQEDEEASMLLPKGTLCFKAEKGTGEILYSSDPSLEGKTVEEAGVNPISLQDGYMGFDPIRGEHRFFITIADNNTIYYYAVEDSLLRKENALYGLISVLFYTIALVILLVFLIREYSEESYRKWVIIAPKWERWNPETEDGRSMTTLAERIRLRTESHRKTDEKDRSVLASLGRIMGWDSMLPEKRAYAVFSVGLFILLQLWVILVLGSYLMHENGQTLLDFLLAGDWMRGFNLFALYSILVCITVANLIIMFSSWTLQLISGFVDAKGQTICRLLQSIIKYISILVAVVMAFSYVGLLNSKVLASMGIGSLAISFGAKDIIADILAGILLVFNETVRVGDIVDYKGTVAQVRDVRIQTTQLVTIPDNDLLTVRNSEISSIVNKSRTPSMCVLHMRLLVHMPLDELETILQEALPGIGAGCSRIIGALNYDGVTGLGADGIYHGNQTAILTIGVHTFCEEKDKTTVKNYLHRELKLLFDKNGIEVL